MIAGLLLPIPRSYTRWPWSLIHLTRIAAAFCSWRHCGPFAYFAEDCRLAAGVIGLFVLPPFVMWLVNLVADPAATTYELRPAFALPRTFGVTTGGSGESVDPVSQPQVEGGAGYGFVPRRIASSSALGSPISSRVSQTGSETRLPAAAEIPDHCTPERTATGDRGSVPGAVGSR
jgi:hypothetical protein